jgi:AcrR family transcriptional regulator
VTLTEPVTTEVEERPTGTRAAARRQAILDAAVSLLIEVGYDRLSMDALAERARAGKATIYRHWSGKAEVVVEAMRSRKCDVLVPPDDTGSLRGDLVALLGSMLETFTAEDAALLIGMVSAMHHDRELADLMRSQIFETKQVVFDEIVARAVRRGEQLPPTASTNTNEVTWALFFNQVAMGGDVDGAFVLHVVDDIVLPLLRC